ncbi:MAG TPA: Flp pilus assembly complex ATPase component TadA [Coprothermobacter sp.]|nr:Flp pilus assembly complex ATPase component TadA [Coprothermobacter sp.]
MERNGYDIKQYGSVNEYVAMAQDLGASDLHFVPATDGVNVFTRINGDMCFQDTISHSEYDRLLNAFKFSSGLDVADSRVSQDARLSLSNGENTVFLRVCILPTVHGESLTLRLPTKDLYPSFEDLGMDSTQAAVFERSVKRGKGVVLITGLTGSGKTSTYYTTLKTLGRANMKVISLEDPVEQFLNGVVQVEVGEKIGFGYKEIIRSALRSDPDVIAIGEIRDEETAKAVMNAAFSSRLVIATMHSRDLSHALRRLMHFGLLPQDLEATMTCLVHQRLISLQNNERVYRTAAFAVRDGTISCAQSYLEELSRLTYESIENQLSSFLLCGERVVRIDGDLEVDYGHL